MLGFRPPGRRVINFTDLESQKSFVYSPFLSHPPLAIRLPTLMGSRLILFVAFPRIPFFSPVLSFLRSSTCLPRFPCLSLFASLPHFQPCSGVSTHRNSVWIQRADTVVQLKSGSDRKLQYSGSCTEEKRPEAGERYRQLLRDRINRMESEVAKCFS